MKSTLLNSIWAVSLLAALAMPFRLTAQEQPAAQAEHLANHSLSTAMV